MEGITDLLQNKLFLQYLAAAGSGLAQGGGAGMAQAVGGVTQQNIAAQNYSKMQQQQMKMIANILRGDVPAGASVKKSPDGKMSFSLPSLSGSVEDDPRVPKGINFDVGGVLNPSNDQPGVSGAMPLPAPSGSDLAGLTPQDMSRALAGAVDVNQLIQTSDILNKKLALQGAAFPVKVPGVGYVTDKQWKALPVEDRAYALYSHNEMEEGKTPLSRIEWERTQPTEREKYIRLLSEDPELLKTEKEIRKSGAPRISLAEKLEETKSKGKLKGQLRFSGGKFAEDITTFKNSKAYRNQIILAGEGQEKTAGTEMLINYVNDQLTASGAKIVDEVYNSKKGTGAWTVVWPNGDEETYTYVLHD